MGKASPRADRKYGKAESDFFIEILADHLSGKQTQSPDNLNWDAFTRLVRAHQLSAVAYIQCKDFIPQSYEFFYKTEYATALFFYTNRVEDMKDISDIFTGAEIPFFSIKGLDIANYYPVPMLRTMGDCDIVISPSHTEVAVNVLNRFGFEGEEGINGHAWNFERKGRHFELHNALVSDSDYGVEDKKDFFNNFMPYVNENHLDMSFHFLFLLMHLRKHFISSGAGMRQFLDLAVIISRCLKLNWEWIEERLKELNLQKYAHACYSLLEAWFGISPPVDYKRLDGESIRLVTERVLNNGVFGFADAGNFGNNLSDDLLRAKGPKWFRRISVAGKRIFIGYSSLKNYQGCEYLKGRPYLTPVAWVHRWVIFLRRGTHSYPATNIRHFFVSDEKLENRKRLFEIMGI